MCFGTLLSVSYQKSTKSLPKHTNLVSLYTKCIKIDIFRRIWACTCELLQVMFYLTFQLLASQIFKFLNIEQKGGGVVNFIDMLNTGFI